MTVIESTCILNNQSHEMETRPTPKYDEHEIIVGVLFGMLSLCANLVFLAMIMSSHTIREDRTFAYICSLAVCNALSNSLMLSLGEGVLWNKDLKPSKVLCLCTLVAIEVSILCSEFHTCLIALDQFLYIQFPFEYCLYVTTARLSVAVWLVWVLAIGVGCVVIFHNTHDTELCCDHMSILSPWYRHMVLAIFFFCLIFNGVVYAVIAVKSIKHSRAMAKGRAHFKMSMATKYREISEQIQRKISSQPRYAGSTGSLHSRLGSALSLINWNTPWVQSFTKTQQTLRKFKMFFFSS
jgi:hypothetical protein